MKFFRNFHTSSTEKNIKVHNSVVCLRGTLLCPQDFGVMILIFFSIISFTFSILYFSFNYLITFLVSFIWKTFEILRNVQFPKIYDALLKPN